MFDLLTQKLQDAFKSLRGKGRLTEADVQDGLRAVRVALLEADVALPVVKDFIASVREKAVGESVLSGIRAGDQVVKIVQDEIAKVLGESDTEIRYRKDGPTVILMAGLQGSGKTTTCGKLAILLAKRDRRKPLLVAADLQRPAAIDQLETIGRQIGHPVFAERGSRPVDVCRRGVAAARERGADLVILDTAGRLHVDEDMMREIRDINAAVSPDEILLVCDAMTGQDAVRSAEAFNQSLPLSGAILTKLDGDTRGGAAMSFRHVTGRPIKFVGVGEQMDKLEPFHPERMAGRILGMGDIVSLVEKAQETMDEDEALRMQEKLLKNRFTLDDFLSQLRSLKKMGSIKDMLGMLPGLGSKLKDMDVDESQLGRVEAFICSMTPEERADVEILDGQRRRRIAKGAGRDVQALNQFLNQYKAMQKMMQGMMKGGGGGGGMMSGLKGMLGMSPASMGAAASELKAAAPAVPLDKEERRRLKELRREKKARRKRSRTH